MFVTYFRFIISLSVCIGTGEGRVWRQPADLPARLLLRYQASVSPSQQPCLGPHRLSADSKDSEWIRGMTQWSDWLRDSFSFVWHTEANCCECDISWEETWVCAHILKVCAESNSEKLYYFYWLVENLLLESFESLSQSFIIYVHTSSTHFQGSWCQVFITMPVNCPLKDAGIFCGAAVSLSAIESGLL